MAHGRTSLLNRVRNWMQLPKVKADLWAALKRTSGPARGIDIPLNDLGDPEGTALTVMAVESLVKEHRELDVLLYPRNIHLCFKRDSRSAMSKALYDQLDDCGFVGKPGDELPLEAQRTDGAASPEDLGLVDANGSPILDGEDSEKDG